MQCQGSHATIFALERAENIMKMFISVKRSPTGKGLGIIK